MDLKAFIAKYVGNKIYEGFNKDEFPEDTYVPSFWGSHSPVFEELILKVRPHEIIELGSWKGTSSIHIGRLLEAHGCDGIICCVDTWLGSNPDLWNEPEYKNSLNLKNGHPHIYEQFLANVSHHGLVNVIYPFPNTTSCARQLLAENGVLVDMIYVDAGHEEEEVLLDISGYWQLLRPGGVMFGDDYSSHLHGVRRAVDRFRSQEALDLELKDGDNKWIFRKPLETSEIDNGN